ncbi:hypothetical protein [Legionella bononiensis]|uniref:Uncharacterized protein n=1 Tax=Legionella bononiensis TaxID=2793102 RepID=A0ABS1WEI9_9GAMM|nr:hypothetical protein [Legionella bononiensis]MBL7479322.1 hypothetical protein [Legionella bononiensis]MBL7479358.1 hypothetical protein [Legionella bononiensis]MBL7527774.1 hypothetical protein [Legionella bononiensis]MBL7563545.1 hypothetical protein [Legionella bononiensis]
MESTPENPPVIFSSEIDNATGLFKLQQKGASYLATKAVWLLRESSVPGLLTLSYYDKENTRYVSKRIGFVEGEWKFGPANRDEAVEFSKQATQAFKHEFPEKSAVKLFTLLSDNGFDLKKQVVPNAIEATRTAEFTGYVSLHEDDDHEPKDDSSKRYTSFT